MITIKHYIHSIDDLETLRSSLLIRHPNSQPVFRGQAFDWPLKPNLARNFNSGDESRFLKTEKELINEFKSSITQNNLTEHIYLFPENFAVDFRNDWQWLIHAQHYELPTRLMDWSLDYHSALYFCTMDNKYINENGVLWVLLANKNNDFWIHQDLCFNINPINHNDTIFAKIDFYPTDNVGNKRRYNQKGNFIVQNEYNSLLPFENNPQYSNNLIKIIIHPDFKTELKEQYKNDRHFFLPERNKQIVEIVNHLKCKFKLFSLSVGVPSRASLPKDDSCVLNLPVSDR